MEASEMEWRDANMVELHDAQVIVRRSDCRPGGPVGWSEFASMGLKATYQLQGVLLNSGALKPSEGKNCLTPLWVQENCLCAGPMADDDSEWGMTHEVNRIQVAEEGDKLHVRTVCLDVEGAEFTQSVTYQGSHTIWWRDQEE